MHSRVRIPINNNQNNLNSAHFNLFFNHISNSHAPIKPITTLKNWTQLIMQFYKLERIPKQLQQLSRKHTLVQSANHAPRLEFELFRL